jgi:hypothetical protein
MGIEDRDPPGDDAAVGTGTRPMAYTESRWSSRSAITAPLPNQLVRATVDSQPHMLAAANAELGSRACTPKHQ